MLTAIFKKSLIIICVIQIMVSCKNKSTFIAEQPNNLIEEGKMKKIMSEMMLLETAIQLKSPDVTTSKKIMKISGNKLLKSFGVDSLNYTESFNYYASNKEVMQQMYNEILEEYNVSVSKLN